MGFINDLQKQTLGDSFGEFFMEFIDHIFWGIRILFVEMSLVESEHYSKANFLQIVHVHIDVT